MLSKYILGACYLPGSLPGCLGYISYRTKTLLAHEAYILVGRDNQGTHKVSVIQQMGAGVLSIVRLAGRYRECLGEGCRGSGEAS